MANQQEIDDHIMCGSDVNEIEEVDCEAGFIIGSCCCSLDLEEDEDLDELEDVQRGMEEDQVGEVLP